MKIIESITDVKLTDGQYATRLKSGKKPQWRIMNKNGGYRVAGKIESNLLEMEYQIILSK